MQKQARGKNAGGFTRGFGGGYTPATWGKPTERPIPVSFQICMALCP